MTQQFGKGHHLHLIDGSAFIFRAYHALPPLTRKSDGLPVGAVSGFVNMLQRYIENNSGDDAATHVAVIFDKGSHTFRNDMYDQYKANRDAMPEDLRPQMPLTRDATRAFNIACEEIEGFEADDIIATLSCQARNAGGRVTILSSDKDMMQLVGDGVEMLDPMKNKRIDRDAVVEKFGVQPERVVDVQALAGDSVDNVPGAPGIGIKTAALLINEYGDLETLLDRAGEIKQPKRRESLLDNRAQIELSKRLVTLDCNMELPFDLDSLEIKDAVPEDLLAFLALMEFRTIVKRIADKLGAKAPEIEAPAAVVADAVPFDASKYEKVSDAAALQVWIDRIYARGYVAVDTETTALNEMRAELVGISLCVEAGQACYIPLTHKAAAQDDLFGSDARADGQMDLRECLAALQPMLEDETILKIGQNMKYDAKIFARLAINVHPIDDTMLMSYAMHGGLHNHCMDLLSERYLGHTPIPIKPLLGTGKSAVTFDRVPIDDAVRYAAEDADITLRLWQMFKPMLHLAKVTTVYETLERPLVPVLAQMEMAGVKVDRDTLSRMSNGFAQKMAGLEDEIQTLAGRKFNVASPKQLGEILFDEMGLEMPDGKKPSTGKTGAYSTGVDVLEDLATIHDLPRRILDWRQLAKLKSTYTDALQEHINAETGRVHTSYSIAGANTGRLASTDPNLQNIPVRSEEGRRIREAFIADEGKVLVSLDYSQIELRILAHVAKIDALKQAFKDGIDIHAQTASEMFDVPLDEMTPAIRSQAKAINFGVIYGISGFGLARNLRIPRAEAQGFIDRYFERFPGIRTYMDETIQFAKDHNYVQTLFGRKINTPEINAKGPQAGFAKRAAINAPIQGTAADVIRRAMIRMPEAIKGIPAKMLLQVHDELIFEVDEDAADDLIKVARDVMENASDPAVKLDVKLAVDAGQGKSWAEAH
ncbi:MAG: DNA polymerase I [Loktanella sp.]|jgi:DNA polymerase-1|nr:DNA polymerase I [Loktanella sp.]MDO7608219.1 DNA polymerase I [Loktanella sp.]MDO7624103.1 DNA polymerase I [Loktanella sp.]MDO7624645.1 DNA polymerase I [Loktanella sp.]MDO7630019.1 DNA polymerase I [Loktanella sp.]